MTYYYIYFIKRTYVRTRVINDLPFFDTIPPFNIWRINDENP